MRHLLITLSFFSACLFCGGCTNEEGMDGEEGRTGENAVALTVHAVMNGFVGIGSDSGSGSDSPQTRVPAEDGLTTEFKTGDAIGVIVVKNGAILNGSDNIKLVYTAGAAGGSGSSGGSGSWATESGGEKLYYYKDATYIAYYPYHTNVTATDATTQSVDEIKAYLRSHADLQPKSNQATSADYTAGDLMIAVATSTADDPGGDTTKKVITLDFEHQFSLLTFSISKHLYYVAPSGANYTYHPASGISPDTDARDVTVNGVAACQTADGEFRVIVTPTAASVTINGEYETTNEVAVRYAETAPTGFAAGNAYQFTVDTQLMGPEFTVIRPLEVGDFYMQNGMIVPGSQTMLTAEQKANCIGIVFKVGAGNHDDASKYDGQLTVINGYVMSLDQAHLAWGDNSKGWTGTSWFEYEGYVYTKLILAGMAEGKSFPACKWCVEHTPVPTGVTSGWYFPSNNPVMDFTGNATALNVSFSKVGGVSISGYYISASEGSDRVNDCLMKIPGDGQTYKNSKSTAQHVRATLTF